MTDMREFIIYLKSGQTAQVWGKEEPKGSDGQRGPIMVGPNTPVPALDWDEVTMVVDVMDNQANHRAFMEKNKGKILAWEVFSFKFAEDIKKQGLGQLRAEGYMADPGEPRPDLSVIRGGVPYPRGAS